MKNRILSWVIQNRTNTRLAFYLQIVTRIASAFLGIFWTRLLLGSMGSALYGQFIAFQGVATLGGLGDLGIGGAVGIRISRYLGSGQEAALLKFLAVARWLFIGLACLIPTALFLLSGYLPGWLGFHAVPGSGDLTALFQLGAINVLLLIVASYINSLNYAVVNLTLTVIPTFLITQMAIVAHIGIARLGFSLRDQYGAYVLLGAAGVYIGWLILRGSNRDLARILPVSFDSTVVSDLAKASGWAYLGSLGAALYYTFDRLIINAYFGAAAIPAYLVNFKLCDLLSYIFVAAGAATVPKLGLWIASPDINLRERATLEGRRVNALQVFAGMTAAYFYFAVNDLFVRFWVGSEMNVTVALQLAFATSLVVGAGYDMAAGLTARVHEKGLRTIGTTVAIGGLINAVLTWTAARNGSIVGVASATIIAQAFQTCRLGAFVSRGLGINPWVWWRQSFAFPILFVAAGAVVRYYVPSISPGSVAVALGGYGLLLLGFSRAVGLRCSDFLDEIKVFSRMFRG